MSRRELLGSTLIAGVGLSGLALGCGRDDSQSPAQDTENALAGRPDPKVLLAFFSRAGENYFNGGRRFLEVGNTEVLARLIEDRTGCDLFKIEPVDPYPESYDETVERNVDEQEADTRPSIAGPLPAIEGYDIVLLGSPVWNVRAPMIMSTFIEALNMDGKTVLPFVTYAVSGLGSVEDDYRSALPNSEVGAGLAVRGETVADSGSDVGPWLKGHDLRSGHVSK